MSLFTDAVFLMLLALMFVIHNHIMFYIFYMRNTTQQYLCLLYTSDAADE